jgi:DUF438 domain-containing protein
MEQQLMDEGLPQEEIKRLCDVHVQVFKEALDRQERVETPPGHPVHTYQAENRALEQEAKALRSHLETLETFGEPPTKQAVEGARQGIEKTLERLSTVETHYVRKENQLFPFLERHGVTGPSQVMWAIHDDVRALVKETRAALQIEEAIGKVVSLARFKEAMAGKGSRKGGEGAHRGAHGRKTKKSATRA